MKTIQTFGVLVCLILSISAHSQRHSDSTEIRDLKGFTGISAGLAANIYLKQGDTYSFKVVGRSRLLERLETSVKDSVLRIRMQDDLDILKDLERVNIYITAPSFQRLVFSGAGKVESDTKLTGERLFVEHSGAHSIDLDVDFTHIEAEMNGVGNIYLKGKANFARLEMSGTGSIDAYDLVVQDANCSVSGLGSIQCFAENDLKTNVSGLGSVKYRGEPKYFKKSVSGLGRVVSR